VLEIGTGVCGAGIGLDRGGAVCAAEAVRVKRGLENYRERCGCVGSGAGLCGGTAGLEPDEFIGGDSGARVKPVPLTDSRSADLRISYRYPDRGKPHAVVHNVVGRFANGFARHRDVYSHMRGATPILQNFEIVETPTRPIVADDQQRIRTISFGCITGVACSFLITPRYISSATMRIVPHDHLSGTAEGRQWLERLTRQVAGQGAAKYHCEIGWNRRGTGVDQSGSIEGPMGVAQNLQETD
jgi:hypothetical protein